MAGQADKRGKKTKRSPKRLQKRLNIGAALCLIFAVDIIALGLKALDDRSRSEEATQTITHREALAVSEHVSGKIAGVSRTLSLAYQAGWGPRQTASVHSDIDAVITLADALTAPTGSRLRHAGETASILLATQQSIGLTSADDVVVVYSPEIGAARLGLVRSERWVPQAQGGRDFSLAEQSGNGVVERAQSGTVRACSPISGSNLSACVQSPAAAYGWTDYLSLLMYAFLLVGPGLAILGLLKMLEERRGQSEAFEGQASRAGQMLETVLQEAKAGFWSWDDKSKQVWLSQEAARMLKISKPGYIGLAALNVSVFPGHHDAVRQAIRTLPERGYIAQTFANQDKTLWLEMRGRPDAKTGDLSGILLDVTDIRTAIARTRQAEQRLRTALEGFSGPFALWDKRKRIIYWNRAFARVFGLENSIRIGMSHETVSLSQATSITDRRPITDVNGAEIIRVQSGEWYKCVERQTSDGGLITMGLDVTADVQNEVELTRQQKKLRMLVTDLERSEGHAGELARKLNEEKLKAERSANSKNAFLANMSHELRTPLNAINGFSEILANQMYGPLGDPRYIEYAGDILTSGQHLLDMINDILDMAKIEAGKMTVDLRPIDLVDPVDAGIRMIRRKAEEKGITLTFAPKQDLPHVDADHRAIRQMILNLLSNAIKFTDDGGEIRVSIDRQGDQLRVCVHDNGVGIPAEALPRLAQPFEQVSDTRDRNYEGSGLGLALTKSFAEMHGGQLLITSEEGKGTQVSFYLPVPTASKAGLTSAA